MRKLKTIDIPALCRTLKRIGVKEQFRTIAMESNNLREAWDKGFELLWGIFDKATEEDGEKHLYEFLAGPFEMTPEEVANLNMGILISNLKQLAEENNLTDFFKFAAKSMK